MIGNMRRTSQVQDGFSNGDLPIQSFAKKDLPESHRVLKPGDMKTMDHNPDRYKVK